jgi:hypothetical protein
VDAIFADILTFPVKLALFIAAGLLAIIAYVLLSKFLGAGVAAWIEAVRREREAKRPEVESELDR